MLKIKNQTENSADLYIYGDIVDDSSGSMLSEWGDDGFEWPKNIKAQLDSLKGKDLNIYINSNGGMVSAGLAMANMIKRHEGHTVAVVDGFCCSIATQIFFAADVQRMPSNAYLMIHKPSVVTMGDAAEMRRAADMLDTIQAGLESTYREHAKPGWDENDIHAMVESTTWLTGDDAADVFDIELLEPVQAAACYGTRDDLVTRHYGDIPAGLKFKQDDPHNADDELKRQTVMVALAKAKGALVK